MTPQELLAGAQHIAGRFPHADLVKNQVGNLVAFVDGEAAGWLDLTDGEFSLFSGWEAADA